LRGISTIRRLVSGIEEIQKESIATKEGIINQSSLLNDKLSEIIGNLVNEQRIINDKLSELIRIVADQQQSGTREQASIAPLPPPSSQADGK
jgi:hypothetical protein